MNEGKAMETKEVTGLNIDQVAEVTGLDRREIYRVQAILALGSPGHFRLLDSRQVYTAAGLAQLAEGLEICGHGPAAALLRARMQAEGGAGWMARHEADQEGGGK